MASLITPDSIKSINTSLMGGMYGMASLMLRSLNSVNANESLSTYKRIHDILDSGDVDDIDRIYYYYLMWLTYKLKPMQDGNVWYICTSLLNADIAHNPKVSNIIIERINTKPGIEDVAVKFTLPDNIMSENGQKWIDVNVGTDVFYWPNVEPFPENTDTPIVFVLPNMPTMCILASNELNKTRFMTGRIYVYIDSDNPYADTFANDGVAMFELSDGYTIFAVNEDAIPEEG
tara:strand:- start:17868 stop:18563 length:696 start_codon:yes stop_codon:yes gene_type:complete